MINKDSSSKKHKGSLDDSLVKWTTISEMRGYDLTKCFDVELHKIEFQGTFVGYKAIHY